MRRRPVSHKLRRVKKRPFRFPPVVRKAAAWLVFFVAVAVIVNAAIDLFSKYGEAATYRLKR